VDNTSAQHVRADGEPLGDVDEAWMRCDWREMWTMLALNMCKQTGPARDVCRDVLAYECGIQGSTKKCLLHHGAE
jgi:hypothetical protein